MLTMAATQGSVSVDLYFFPTHTVWSHKGWMTEGAVECRLGWSMCLQMILGC